jgi:DNA-directed RNA polymerase II subunit RPB2
MPQPHHSSDSDSSATGGSRVDAVQWDIIDKYFAYDEQALVKHHIASYNLFMKDGISKILRDENPISLEFKDATSERNNLAAPIQYKCTLHLGGPDGSKVYYGKPVIYDYDEDAPVDESEFKHYMYPNEARLRNMTYSTTLRVDVDVELVYPNPDYEAPVPGSGSGSEKPKFVTTRFTIPRVYLGKLPIMVQSDLCILKGLNAHARYYMGECRNDHGGYFIIDGKEKVIISQEKFADNLINVRVLGVEGETSGEVYTHSADIRTISEDPSKPVRTMSVRVQAPTPSHTQGNIVVLIPNVRSPVPLFIVMRALGIESDRAILEHCLYDLEANESLLELFVPSVHDANRIFTQQQALAFIGMLTKLGNDKNATRENTIICAHEILSDYFLPQVGDMNYQHKAYMLGYIVNKLVRVVAKIDLPTDRDSFRNKRVDTSGALLYDLFREYYKLQFKTIRQSIDKMYYYDDTGKYQGGNFVNLLNPGTYQTHFKELVLEQGIRRAFKGRWGSTTQTKRVGVVQDVNRLSHNSFISHLRKINLELGSETLVKPRLLHSSQWGVIDPVDVPDGANTGLHKHLSMTAHITSGCSAQPMIEWLRRNASVRFVDECYPLQLFHMTKVLINGTLWAVTDKPIELLRSFKFCRRVALIPVFISISWRYSVNEIHVFTDAGRLCRPLFYNERDQGGGDDEAFLRDVEYGGGATAAAGVPVPSYARMMTAGTERVKKWTWSDLVSGTAEKTAPGFDYQQYRFYNMDELYGGPGPETEPGAEPGADPESESNAPADKSGRNRSTGLLSRLRRNQAVVEYLDQSETESAFISMEPSVTASEIVTKQQQKKHSSGPDAAGADIRTRNITHFEIHPSLILGVMGNQIAFVENNPFPRDAFGCGQAKQTASVYHTNFFSRIDKMSMVINNGQVPLVKSRFLEYINNEEHPNGENAIVAVACYNGYNVEDSILFNEAAVKRGLFNITYYNMYEDCEEGATEPGAQATSFFSNSASSAVRGVNSDHDYRHLESNGIVKENTELTEKVVVIGKLKRSEPGGGGGSQDELFSVPTVAKKGQLGYVDRTYVTEGMKGTRIAKVRVREHRLPAVGDKFCSRCGQKGTVGIIVPERDMPFTADGIRPDIIINPHAIPSRMTLGQFIETIVGKACVMTGSFGDCTAFSKSAKGAREKVFGEVLAANGFHPSGNQVLYNGMTGEQIESEIFIGPTYYMRLKQMVKDKINYRRTGPNTALTRQPVQGRANDGGLRVGEMERDSIISHGTARFLQESMMKRGDQYYLAICNVTGMIAVYNESQDLFVSPMADGPIKYAGSMTDLKSANVVNVTRHGRSFSIVHIPYSLKLLIQELQVLNVQMRIITDANVDSISSMASSHNIEKLMMQPGADLATVALASAEALGVENTKPSMVAHLKVTESDYESDGSRHRSEIDGDGSGNGSGDGSGNGSGDGDDYGAGIATSPHGRDEDDGDGEGSSGVRRKRRNRARDVVTDFPDTSGMSAPELVRVAEERGWMLVPELSDRHGETFASVVTNEYGKPTEFWHTTQNAGRYPNRYPRGWTAAASGPGAEKWNSSRPLELADKVAALKLFPEPVRNNLKLAHEYLLQFKSDKYPRLPFHYQSSSSSSSSSSSKVAAMNPEADTATATAGADDEIFQGNSVAVLHSRLISVGKQISGIEMKVQQVRERTESGQTKEYQKDDILEIEALVRGLVKLQAERDRLTKQLADEQLVKSITSNIVESPSPASELGTPGSGLQTPPYTAMSPVSPMMMMQVPVPMQPMPMQPMQMQSMPMQSMQPMPMQSMQPMPMQPMQSMPSQAKEGDVDTENTPSTTRKIVLK